MDAGYTSGYFWGMVIQKFYLPAAAVSLVTFAHLAPTCIRPGQHARVLFCWLVPLGGGGGAGAGAGGAGGAGGGAGSGAGSGAAGSCAAGSGAAVGASVVVGANLGLQIDCFVFLGRRIVHRIAHKFSQKSVVVVVVVCMELLKEKPWEQNGEPLPLHVWLVDRNTIDQIIYNHWPIGIQRSSSFDRWPIRIQTSEF